MKFSGFIGGTSLFTQMATCKSVSGFHSTDAQVFPSRTQSSETNATFADKDIECFNQGHALSNAEPSERNRFHLAFSV